MTEVRGLVNEGGELRFVGCLFTSLTDRHHSRPIDLFYCLISDDYPTEGPSTFYCSQVSPINFNYSILYKKPALIMYFASLPFIA